MLCLGIDTSGETLSVGLSSGGKILGERIYHGDRPHSVMLIAEMETLLKGTDVHLDRVTLIAATAGPGRYTALRVGMATAKGIAMARGVPMIRVSTLEVLARGVLPHEGSICTILDARRRLVYFARFEAAGAELRRVENDQALSYGVVASLVPEGALLTGDGVSLLMPSLRERGVTVSSRQGMIHGGHVAGLGEAIYGASSRSELYEGPTYIRKVEIHNPNEKKGGKDDP